MYKTINGWTKQSMIEHIKKEFKGKSADSDDQLICMYRGPSGTKCAVGMFIPDDKFNQDFENRSFSDLQPRIHPYMPLLKMEELQIVHDTSHPDHTLTDILKWVESNVR